MCWSDERDRSLEMCDVTVIRPLHSKLVEPFKGLLRWQGSMLILSRCGGKMQVESGGRRFEKREITRKKATVRPVGVDMLSEVGGGDGCEPGT